jgi:hypothetical protein
MKAPIENEKFYELHGNKYENLMADNSHIYQNDLDEADKEKEDIELKKQKE